MSGRPSEDAIERIRELNAEIARLLDPGKPCRRDLGPLVAYTAIVRADHPDWSRNTVAASVPFRRSDVLRAVKLLEAARRVVPEPGNHDGEPVA
jgi:hypothetical protein